MSRSRFQQRMPIRPGWYVLVICAAVFSSTSHPTLPISGTADPLVRRAVHVQRSCNPGDFPPGPEVPASWLGRDGHGPVECTLRQEDRPHRVLASRLLDGAAAFGHAVLTPPRSLRSPDQCGPLGRPFFSSPASLHILLCIWLI